MISNGRSMKCGGHCENVHLQIGQYHMKYHMFSINMGSCDIVYPRRRVGDCSRHPDVGGPVGSSYG